MTTPYQPPLRLGLLSSQLNWGGGEQLLLSLGTELMRQGHEVYWMAPEASALVERVRLHGGECLTWKGRRPSPAAVVRLRSEIVSREVNVLHGNDSHAISLATALTLGRLSRPRIVGVKHTIFPIRSASRYNWLVDEMVCVSRSVRDVCADSGILESRLRVVHGGMEIEPIDRVEARQDALEKLDIDDSTPLLCAVGSLVHCKGFDILIEAADRMRKQLPNFRLVLCGEGPQRPQLESLIHSHGLSQHITLAGFCDDPNRWIAAADLFVHPSRSEGLSLVTIAAQLLGTPVVASEVGGLREVMHCGHTHRPLGWIFASQNPDDLAELLLDAMFNQPKRLRLIEEARESARLRFNLTTMADGFLRAYDGHSNTSDVQSRYALQPAA